MSPKVLLIMGVSGTGKSTVLEQLSIYLNCPTIEGDNCHSQSNIAKMASDIPLQDEDRWPWLDAIVEEANKKLMTNDKVLFTCSALKEIYRRRLKVGIKAEMYLLYLNVKPEILLARMKARKNHYMKSSMLQSQLDILEIPSETEGIKVINVDVDTMAPTEVLKECIKQLELAGFK